MPLPFTPALATTTISHLVRQHHFSYRRRDKGQEFYPPPSSSDWPQLTMVLYNGVGIIFHDIIIEYAGLLSLSILHPGNHKLNVINRWART